MSRLQLIMIMMGLISLVLLSGCANTSVSVWDGVIRNENGNAIINEYNNSLVVENREDFETQRGTNYIGSDIVNIGSGENYQFLAQTNGKEVHLNLRKIVIIDLENKNTKVNIDLYEDVTNITTGNQINTFNLNRNKFDNHTFKIYENSNIDYTNSTYLKPLSNYLTSEKQQASFLNEQIKYIMKYNTTYGLNVTNEGIGDIQLRLIWNWFETDKLS